MAYNAGKLLTILILAVVLACVAAWVVARRYRRAMRRLMSVPVMQPETDAAPETTPTEPLPPPVLVTFADNRRLRTTPRPGPSDPDAADLREWTDN